MNGFPNTREKGKHFCSGTVKIGALFQKCLPGFGESAEQLRSNSQPFAILVVSCLQLAKHAFVRVLLIFAAQYQVAITVNRHTAVLCAGPTQTRVAAMKIFRSSTLPVISGTK